MQAPAIISAVLLGAIVLFLFLELRPGMLFSGTVPMQGDTSNQIYPPYFLAHDLLPHAKLMGWSPGWFRGFPAFTFYFVLPNLLIALLSHVIPFAVAFKLIAVSGILTLPIAAWGMAKLVGYKAPTPVVFAVAMLPFLFERSYGIFGGNIASTISGEYCESIGISVAVLALGVAARGLDTGRMRVLFALLLAVVILCHVLPAAFLIAGVLILFLLQVGRAAAKWLFTSVLVALGVAAFWLVPYGLRISYSPNVHAYHIPTYLQSLFPFGHTASVALNHGPAESVPFILIVLLAVGGAVVSWTRFLAVPRGPERLGVCFSVLAVLSALVFIFAPHGIDQSNGKALPFWFLSVYVLAAIGVVEGGSWLGARWRKSQRGQGLAWSWVERRAATQRQSAAEQDSPPPKKATKRSGYPTGFPKPGTVVAPIVIFVVGLLFVTVPLRISFLTWIPGTPSAANASAVPTIVDQSFSANHDRPGWAEFVGLVNTMKTVGSRFGCGTAMWSFDSDQRMGGSGWDLGGLPYWTNGCVGAALGIQLESSATAPPVLQAMSSLSETTPFGPAGAPTQSRFNVSQGVEQLQMLGVRYFMTSTEPIVQEAAQDSALQPVATSGPWSFETNGTREVQSWHIYLVRNSTPVAPIADEPTVLSGVSTNGQEWTNLSSSWFGDTKLRNTLYTADGPPGWLRANPSSAVTPRPLPSVKVSAIRQTDDSISFNVNKTGVPVLVKTSYFPNWQVSGGTGPYRTLPNLMIVVPTTKHVVLHYEHTAVDYLGWFLTLLGLAGAVYLWRLGPVRIAQTRRAAAASRVKGPPRPSPNRSSGSNQKSVKPRATKPRR